MNRWQFLKKHFGRFWKIYIGVLTVPYIFYRAAKLIGEPLGGWITGHFAVQNGVASIDNFGKAALAYGSLIAIGLLVVAVASSAGLYRATRDAAEAEKTPILRKTFRRSTEAADLIAKKLFPGVAPRIKLVRRCKQVYTIYKDGDCYVTEELVVAAKDKDIHFMEKIIDAEDEADPVEFPDEIDLKIDSKTPGRHVRYLISKNEPRSKGVVIFFLPRIKANEGDERELKISYHWKGFMRRLVTVGDEPFNMGIKSVEPIPSVEYQFWIKPKEGQLTCRHIGEALEEGKELLDEQPLDNKGMGGWVYTAKEVPIGHMTRLKLELKRN